MNSRWKNSLSLAVGTLLWVIKAQAQIGIGTTSPHPSAMLHISAGAGNNKGLLMPKVTSAQRIVLDSTQNIANGLVMFDTDLQKFYYFGQSPRVWKEIDSDWIRKDVAGASPVMGTHIYAGVSGNVGIGTASNVNPGSKLTVVGNMSVGTASYTQDSVAPAFGATFGTWIGVATRTRTPGAVLDVKGPSHFRSGDVTVDQNVTANRFFGEGIVPVGLISMWSGNAATSFTATGLGLGDLDGWALCDGRNGTPDLRGRFIVGLSNTDPTTYTYVNSERNLAAYNTIGNNGGERTHVLTLNEMPNHDHGGSTSTDGNHEHSVRSAAGACTSFSNGPSQIRIDGNCNSNYDNSTAGNMEVAGAHNHTITPEGSGLAHENRPPYYVLAYIMKRP